LKHALAQTLIETDLVDDRLFVHPLVLGIGKRLFRQTLPIPLGLTGCTTPPPAYCSSATSRGIAVTKTPADWPG